MASRNIYTTFATVVGGVSYMKRSGYWYFIYCSRCPSTPTTNKAADTHCSKHLLYSSTMYEACDLRSTYLLLDIYGVSGM